MTISRVKPAGWGVGDKLTSAEQNQVDTNATYALDKRSGQTDTLESAVTLTNKGRLILSVATGADADTTYAVGAANRIIHVSTLTANRIYTLSNTGAATGEVLEVFVDPALAGTYGVTVKDAGASTLFTVGNGSSHDGPWASFIYIGGWKLYQHRRRVDTAVTEFTASGTWTCPANVSKVLLIGYGGGGGGGGADTPIAAIDQWASGGGGGGGAWQHTQIVTVVPGTIYTVTIGTGGAGGAAGSSGSDGGATSFDTLATFPGAAGASAGASTTSSSARGLALGGTPSSYGKWWGPVTTLSYEYQSTTRHAESTLPGRGGYGQTNHVWALSGFSGQSAVGKGSPSQCGAYAGGATGVGGSDSGSYRGGGAGGGGGAGPRGAGGAGGGGGNGNNAASGAAGTAGTAAAVANSGAGGGGGGAGGAGVGTSGAGAAGAAGADGWLAVIAIR